MTYFWETDDWPNFTYELDDSCEKNLYAFAQHAGRVGGLVEGLDDKDQSETLVQMMVAEAIKTSEIEGEYLSRQDVISSVRNNLGLSAPLENVGDKRAEGAAALMMEHAMRECGKELTRACVIQNLENMDGFDVGGVMSPITYGKGNRFSVSGIMVIQSNGLGKDFKRISDPIVLAE